MAERALQMRAPFPATEALEKDVAFSEGGCDFPLVSPGPAQKAPWMSRDGARALGIPGRAAGLAGAQLSWSPALGQGGRSAVSLVEPGGRTLKAAGLDWGPSLKYDLLPSAPLTPRRRTRAYFM